MFDKLKRRHRIDVTVLLFGTTALAVDCLLLAPGVALAMAGRPALLVSAILALGTVKVLLQVALTLHGRSVQVRERGARLAVVEARRLRRLAQG